MDIEIQGQGGDAESYHIPQAMMIEGRIFNHLITGGGNFNGRLTQVLLYIYSEIILLFNLDLKYGNIHNVAYIFNTLFCCIALILSKNIILIATNDKVLSRCALWFLALNPYFIIITGIPQKEALLFLGLSIFAFSLVEKKRSFKYILLSFFIIAMERIYMIPLLALIRYFYLSEKISIKIILFFILNLIFIEYFIGIEAARFMLENNSESMKDGYSYLGEFNFFNDLIRAYFGPFALRNFMDGNINFSILECSNYILFFFYPFIAVKATFNLEKFGWAIFLTIIFVATLIPYHSSFKIMMITFFGGLFLTMSRYELKK